MNNINLKFGKIGEINSVENKDIEQQSGQSTTFMKKRPSSINYLKADQINIGRLKLRKIELLAQLQNAMLELDLEHKRLADLTGFEEQKARLKLAIKNVLDMTKSLKVLWASIKCKP